MKYFAGMDVSLEETAICVVDETGRVIKEARAASEPEALHALLCSFSFPFECVGLEACSLTAWLHSELTSAGWPAICIESRHAKAAMGAMPNKTDRNDARAIAQIMRRYAPASLQAIEPTAPGACGTTCWRKECRAACIGSSD